MVRIPTPIPETWVQWFRDVVGRSPVDFLWWALVTSFIVGVAYLLVVGLGVIGSTVAGIMLATLVSQEVRDTIRDVYNRDFWVFSP